jgi:hypothetical protein
MFVLILIAAAILFSAFQTNAKSNSCTLPDITFLGEGINTYVLPSGYNGFLVKTTRPFKITKVNANTVEINHRNNRVWASSSFTETLVTLYDDQINLGTLQAGTKLDIVIIDDDNENDNRLTELVSTIDGHVYSTYNNGMVSYITFHVQVTDEYTIRTHDSIGFVKACITTGSNIGDELEPKLYGVYMPIATQQQGLSSIKE